MSKSLLVERELKRRFVSGFCSTYHDQPTDSPHCKLCPGACWNPKDSAFILCRHGCHTGTDEERAAHLVPPTSSSHRRVRGGSVTTKTDDGADEGSARPSREGDDMTETTTEGKKARALKADPIRDAIAADGRVEVPLQDPTDAAERKRVVNTIFGRAYTLGLKGKFEVKVVDGVAIGQTKADA